MNNINGMFLEKNIDLFCCPKCESSLVFNFDKDTINCISCKEVYEIKNNIPQLFYFDGKKSLKKDVTETMKDFYEETPFPDYDNYDNTSSLIEKSRKGFFAKILDEQIPFGAKIIECGCGTGQLTNFLSIANRSVFGVDMCLNSLRLGQDFKEKNNLNRVFFSQMNLFKPCFKKKSFDIVISNGVLHHTSDPYLGFQTIASLLKPKGYILIGLYHKYGRILNDIRRYIFSTVIGNKMRFLDKRTVSKKYSKEKRNSWFMDQYKNPYESKHTIEEVLTWFKKNNIQFIKSIPKDNFFGKIKQEENLFKQDVLAGKSERFLVELAMIITNSKEGGFFIVVGQKMN